MAGSKLGVEPICSTLSKAGLPVAPPKGTVQYQQWFCAVEPGNLAQLKANEAKRVELYKAVAAVTRCYANLANEMETAGYTAEEAVSIKAEITHYTAVRNEVKLGAGENLDLKQYEAGMRFLLDTYIQANASEVIADFTDTGLIQLIAQMGKAALNKLPNGIRKDPRAVAATIVNNMRKVIIDERAMNPKYYDKMSTLLDALIEEHQKGTQAYEEYLRKLIEAARQLGTQTSDTQYPDWASNGARRALVDFFHPDDTLAIHVDEVIWHTKPDSWVGDRMKERKVRNALKNSLPDGFDRLDELFDLVRARDEYR